MGSQEESENMTFFTPHTAHPYNMSKFYLTPMWITQYLSKVDRKKDMTPEAW